MTSSGKIYTKGGDAGKTSLVSGQRVEKSHPLLNAYGTVDELNAACGIAACECGKVEFLSTAIYRIQNQLFTVGSQLSCTDETWRAKLPQITNAFVEVLENEIDKMTSELAELKQFILPGGSNASAHLHLCRTVCRRAERQTFLAETQLDTSIDPVILVYLNRLSDWFFTAARYANFKLGHSDREWQKNDGAL